MLKSSKTRTNVKVFWPPIFSGGTTPTFLRHIVREAYGPPFDKVWLSSVCWSPSAKPDNEVECGIYIGWAKMQVEFEAVYGPKFTTDLAAKKKEERKKETRVKYKSADILCRAA